MVIIHSFAMLIVSQIVDDSYIEVKLNVGIHSEVVLV